MEGAFLLDAVMVKGDFAVFEVYLQLYDRRSRNVLSTLFKLRILSPGYSFLVLAANLAVACPVQNFSHSFVQGIHLDLRFEN